MDQVKNLKRTVSKLAFLSNPIDPKTRPGKRDLVAAGNILIVLALGTSSTVYSSCNAIVFNSPDGVPMNGRRDQILAACGMAHIPSLMTRLRNRIKRHSCLLMLQFQTNILPKLSSRKQSVIFANEPFKTIKITTDTSHDYRRKHFVSKMLPENSARPVAAEPSP